MTTIINEIFDLFARDGSKQYGEDISLESHMLQSAACAEAMASPRHLVVAALLHDIGYFLNPGSENSIDEGRNFEHEALGAAWLSQAFGEEVTAPIALHVEAKRYLCAVEATYFEHLSQASRLSLMTQGGAMTADEAAAFAKAPHFEAAILLRRCDDHGKDLATTAPPLEHYRSMLTSSLRQAD